MAEPSPAHLRRDAYIYVRQSTLAQTIRNTESLTRQYDLAGRARALAWEAEAVGGDKEALAARGARRVRPAGRRRALGWAAEQVVVVDDDLGRSGATAQGRAGFSEGV